MSLRMIKLVLLVSLAHAMVHTLELAFPAVEKVVADDWLVSTATIGFLATSWSFPFGAFAFGGGWLADKLGSKIVLVIYLAGSSIAALAIALAGNLPILFASLFVSGSFASLYHPAGLAYISRLVDRKDLGPALGYHGILGSIGIAGAPFLSGLLLSVLDWQGVYFVLAAPAILLALALGMALPGDRPTEMATAAQEENPRPAGAVNWRGFAAICLITMLFGMIYRGFVTFLPRYLGESNFDWGIDLADRSVRNYLTAGVLLLGVIGQHMGGRLCARFRAESVLIAIMFANVPFLMLMGTATGPLRVLVTGAFAIVHFMMQPVSNSLIAHYTPPSRRSLGYGINFVVSFGVGSLGATYAGLIAERFGTATIFPGLGLPALAAGTFAYFWTRPPAVLSS